MIDVQTGQRRAWQAVLALSCMGTLDPAMGQQTLDRVEITGSSIRRIDAESAFPVQVIRRETIERSGYTSTVDLMKNLPAVMGSTVETGTVGGESYGFSGVSIHNLGENRTLVLLNGRRLAPFGGQTLTGASNAIDLNSIPISAIERIEVLTDGASALYGSDAIAGVVNFITRRGSTDGVGSAGISFPRGGARETNLSVSKGFGDLDADGYNVMLSASSDRRTQLAAADRKFARTGEIHFKEGGQKYRFQASSILSIPANVFDLDFNAHSPYLQAHGKCPPKHFVSGTACAYDFSSDLEIYPDRERQSLVASFDRTLAGNARLFGDVVFARSRSRGTVSYNPSLLTISPDSPYFDQAVAAGGYNNTDPSQGDLGVLAGYRFADLGRRVTDDRSEALHAVLGVMGTLGSWDYNIAYTHSQSTVRGSLDDGYGYNSRVLNALNTVVNPFALPGQQTPEAQQAIADAKYTGYWNGGRSTLDGVEARGTTELVALPGGAMQLGAGVSAFRERISTRPSALAQAQGGEVRFGDDAAEVPSSGSRNVLGAFAELVAPVAKGVELTASVRHDHYSDFGNTTNAKLSGRWQPVPGLLIRGSVGMGYKAPSILQVKASRQKYGLSGGNLDCGRADNNGVTLNDIAASLGPDVICTDGVQADVIAQGNNDLKPERSTQASLGFRIEPVSALSFGADFWTVGIKDTIGQLSEGAIFSDYTLYRDSFTSSVSAATGRKQLAVFAPNLNQGKSFTSGIDFDVVGRMNLKAGVGVISQLTATYMLRDQYQSLEGGDYASSLGRLGENGAVTFRWQARWVNSIVVGAATHTLALNYKSGYRDQDFAATGLVDVNLVNADGSIGERVDSLKRRVSDHLTVDWQTHWRVSNEVTLNVGVINVFDKDPPLSMTVGGFNQGFQIGYDDRYYDPRGQTLYANLSYRF
ncbi:MAG: TonB-dependent receptor [Burkholderiaceae bacterium]|nr:TonB-dependent receptor [Burkholderiaceae bacterium]